MQIKDNVTGIVHQAYAFRSRYGIKLSRYYAPRCGHTCTGSTELTVISPITCKECLIALDDPSVK